MRCASCFGRNHHSVRSCAMALLISILVLLLSVLGRPGPASAAEPVLVNSDDAVDQAVRPRYESTTHHRGRRRVLSALTPTPVFGNHYCASAGAGRGEVGAFPRGAITEIARCGRFGAKSDRTVGLRAGKSNEGRLKEDEHEIEPSRRYRHDACEPISSRS
jgi:hypothetical protein